MSEALRLTWDEVDWEGHVLRLAPQETKGGEARLFPFRQAPDLKALLEERWRQRRGVFVFHHNAKPLRALRRCWATACLRAGFGTRDPVTKKVAVARLVHDLRRTFARTMRRAGVSEGEVMRLAGWRTRSMFDRYSIVSEADLSDAVARGYGNLTATSGGAVPPSCALPSSGTTSPL